MEVGLIVTSRQYIRSLHLIIAVLFIVTACSAGMHATRMQLSAGADANGNRPIQVDLVTVADRSLISVLSTLTAQQWFAQRQEILRNHQAGLGSLQLEIVPGNSIERNIMHRSAEAIFVFALYQAPGLHRLRLDGIEQPLVRFGPLDMQVVARDQKR